MASPDSALLALIRYLLDHPDAMDSAAGIERWWRSPEQPQWTPAELHEALEALSARNWIVVREAAGEKLFAANPGAREEILLFLREWQAKKE